MENTNTFIAPWSNASEWKKLNESIHVVANTPHVDLHKIYDFAKSIHQLYITIADPMEELCSLTCVDCQDICCKKATVWYDFKDLIYLHFSFNSFPKSQISKTFNEKIQCSCCNHFEANGCTLSRLRRPFICTWYICPSQKNVISKTTSEAGQQIIGTIEQIKILRKQMKLEFSRISFDIDERKSNTR